MVAIGQQLGQGFPQLLLGIRQLHTDGTAAVDDLHGAGDLQLLHQTGDIGGRVMDVTPRRRANPLRLQKPLGNGFVHGHAAAQIARAGVGYSQQIQRGLNTTVLAAGAVERQKHDIRHGAHRQHVLAQQGRPLILPTAAHGLQIRSLLRDPVVAAQAVRGIEDILQPTLIALQPQEHIHQNSLMSPLPQRPAHTGAGGQSHLTLRAESTGQHNDLHKLCLAFA